MELAAHCSSSWDIIPPKTQSVCVSLKLPEFAGLISPHEAAILVGQIPGSLAIEQLSFGISSVTCIASCSPSLELLEGDPGDRSCVGLHVHLQKQNR